MKDICCIGHLTRDKIVTPESTVFMAGGTSFYFAHALNHLPAGKVSFQLVTKVGEESIPEIDKMREAGIDVVCHNSANSVYFENKYGADTNRRTQRVLAKADPFTLEEVEPLEAKVFHLGSLLADDFPIEVVEALSRKGLISIDVQGYLREVKGEAVIPCEWKQKEEILAMTDILKLNEYEMQVITDSNDPHTVARKLASMGVREVVLTFGDYGSLIYAEGQYFEVPAYKPQHLVDATGCGDTYSAGYLYCRSQGMSYAESGRFAAAMCTLKLEHHGPFCRSVSEIEAIMNRPNCC
ncbi:MAG: ribokinase [Prevotella sp.]|nr:ribokinase [Prevotella sp.]